MKIKIKNLEKLILEVLVTEYSPHESELIKDVVLFGELSGRPTHGIIRLLKENYGVFVDGRQVRIPGEHTLQTRDENLKRGEIEVNEDIVNKIKQQISPHFRPLK